MNQNSGIYAVERSDSEETKAGGYRRLALALSPSLFMQSVDLSTLSPALPTMARDLNIPLVESGVVITAYVLSFITLMPASNAISRRLGARSTYLAAVALFTLGSLLSAFAPDITLLAMARFLQGAGGGAMMSVGRLILVRSVPKQNLMSALNWFMLPSMVGPLIGPPIGGYLTTYLSWHWIFLINVPIGLLAIVLVALFIREPAQESPGRLDLVGLLQVAALLAALILSLDAASSSDWIEAGVLLIVSAGFALVYYRHASGMASPVLDIRLTRLSPFGSVLLIGSLTRLSGSALQFLVLALLQLVIGLSAAETGLLMTTGIAGALLARFATNIVLKRTGFRSAALHTAGWATLLSGVHAFFSPAWPIWAIGLVFFVIGLIRSLQLFICGTLAYDGMPQENIGDATTLFVLSQQLMLSLGVAVSVALLALLGATDEPSGPQLAVAILIVTLLSALAIPVTARLERAVGAELMGAKA